MVAGIRLDASQRAAFFDTSKLLRDRGLADLAKVAAAQLQPTAAQVPTVVVIGEVKRGKSSLVNSLLGQPKLSPIGVDLTTGVQLKFLPATDDFTAGRARLVLADEVREIDITEVPDWATVSGSKSEDPDAPLVRRVEVAVVGTKVPGIALVDTPGVGGLDSGHAQIARRAVNGASLLLFVADAGAPLTAPELKFLAECSESTESVVIAITKVDKYPAGWREVISENRKLLQRHAPRFKDADLVPISNALADEAITTTDQGVRQALEKASGIGKLSQIITSRLLDSEQIQIANALRTLLTGIDQVEGQLTARREAASGSPEVRANLEAERERLETLRLQQNRWTLDLDRDLGGIRSQAVTASTLHFTELREKWTARIAHDKQAMLPSGRRQMMTEVMAELGYSADILAAGVYEHLRYVVRGLFQDELVAGQVLSQTSQDHLRIQPRGRALRPSGVSLLDPSLVTTALFGAGIAKGMFAAGAAGASIFAPIALAVGGAWLAVNATHRVIKGGRSQLQTWMTESVSAVQTDLISAADTVIREFRPEVIVAFRDYIAKQAAELKATLREAELAAAASEKERKTRTASFDRHLAALAAQRAAVLAALKSTTENSTTENSTAENSTAGKADPTQSPVSGTLAAFAASE